MIPTIGDYLYQLHHHKQYWLTRAERRRAHSMTSVAGINSSCQACTIEVGTRAASSAGIGPIRSGGTIRNSARVGTCSEAIAET